ncbi:MAG: kynureninase [Deltaproteobacteria bacterium]|jgi:kynureninase|nr:kynureninase [Deltaproteobacteria bacterium]
MTVLTRKDFLELDARDPLVPFREEFHIPEKVIYMDGNSLGAMPKTALERVREVTEREWGRDLIKSWNTADWFNAPQRIGDKIAAMIGAKPGEVVATDSTGINLFKALSAALTINSHRSDIVMEGSNFPTDNYITQGLIAFLGKQHHIRFVEKDDIMNAIDNKVSVVSLTDVHYKTGHRLNMQAITARAHEYGALTVWDLCHSAGALPIDLNAAGADFAVGCGYKYLNGGPGAPAFIFVAARHQDKAKQPLTGWWSHRAPFEFTRDYESANGINRMLSGTQPMISLCVLEVGVDIMARADIQAIREKSKKMGDLFIAAVEQSCKDFGFGIASPRNADRRGSHVSLTHENGYAIMQALIERGVIGDFRSPDILRFGLTPLYLRYVDVWDAVEILADIMASETWKDPKYHARAAVT